MSLNKKLVTYHIARLKDRRVDIRLDAIHELAELGDPEALAALQETFKTDSDLEVRKAAQEAGRQIFVKQQKS